MDALTYSFVLEFDDREADVTKEFLLLFFKKQTVGDTDEVELLVAKTKQRFVCKSPTDLRLSDLSVGARVTLNSRQFVITRPGDRATERYLATAQQSTLALVLPKAQKRLGDIIDAVAKAGFAIKAMQSCRLSGADAQAFAACAGLNSRQAADLTEGAVTALQLIAADAAAKWQAARPIGVHASTPSTAAAEVDFFFGPRTAPSVAKSAACLRHCSLCVIKPHAVKAGHAGAIINEIVACGFEITAADQISMSREDAQEFLSVYRGVIRDHAQHVSEFWSGPCIALEVYARDAVKVLREFVGPRDVVIAQTLSPECIRAKYGINKILNAVHCTDLPEDGALECNFFFNVLRS